MQNQPLPSSSCFFRPVSQLTSTVTRRTTTASTTRPAPTACCPKTPPCCPTAPPRADTFSSLVSNPAFLRLRLETNPQNSSAEFSFCLSSSSNRRAGAVRVGDLQEAGRVPAVPPAVPLLRHRSDTPGPPPYTPDPTLCCSSHPPLPSLPAQTCARTTGKALQPRQRTQRTLRTPRSEAPTRAARRPVVPPLIGCLSRAVAPTCC